MNKKGKSLPIFLQKAGQKSRMEVMKTQILAEHKKEISITDLAIILPSI
jgi:hypothetical protein